MPRHIYIQILYSSTLGLTLGSMNHHDDYKNLNGMMIMSMQTGLTLIRREPGVVDPLPVQSCGAGVKFRHDCGVSSRHNSCCRNATLHHLCLETFTKMFTLFCMCSDRNSRLVQKLVYNSSHQISEMCLFTGF